MGRHEQRLVRRALEEAERGMRRRGVADASVSALWRANIDGRGFGVALTGPGCGEPGGSVMFAAQPNTESMRAFFRMVCDYIYEQRRKNVVVISNAAFVEGLSEPRIEEVDNGATAMCWFEAERFHVPVVREDPAEPFEVLRERVLAGLRIANTPRSAASTPSAEPTAAQ
jgi:hypothetical protein